MVFGFQNSRGVKVYIHRIDSVNIGKRPPGTLIVTVRERVPVAALVLDDGQSREIDLTGMSLEVISASFHADLPVITGAGIVDLLPGEKATGPGSACALSVISNILISAGELFGVVSEIDVRDPKTPRLVLTNGSYVYLSGTSIEDGLSKLSAGYQLLDQFQIGFSHVDLRFSHRAVVVPEEGAKDRVLTTIAEGSAR